MDTLPARRPDALVVDVQGVPKNDPGADFKYFNQWLALTYQRQAPALIYLLRKGVRKPAFKLEGTVIKKPFPLEALGEALREGLGRPATDGARPRMELDLSTNTLRGDNGEAHLTHIEATLLAYLIEHAGEILHPQHLLVDVWQYHHAAGASTLVRAHISNLRKKVREVNGSAEQIETFRGKGYRYSA